MNIRIDLLSDTVTKPTPGMMEAMMKAEVGDDVFAEDPTINALQDRLAEMFGMEAGLFCPSGTMANQIAINVHTSPGDEVICSDLAHIYLYEGGGIARNSGASVRLLSGDRGRFTAEQVEAAVNPPDAHYASTRLVSLENTCNKGGGACYDPAEVVRISDTCLRLGLGRHLDGARLFNAIVRQKLETREIGKSFDSISICLSKGLGAPVGSVLIGTKEFIQKAHRVRKVMGGGMRQAGILAAAGLYALDHHIDRLQEDHDNAAILGEALAELPWVKEVLPVETNIVIFDLAEEMSSADVVKRLAEKGLRCAAFGPHKVRFVTHLDLNQEMVEEAVEICRVL